MSVLYVILDTIRFLCYLFGMLILVRSIMSWFSPRPTNVLAAYLYRVTEPLLVPVRRLIPRTGIVDFSPLVVILLLYLVTMILGLLY